MADFLSQDEVDALLKGVGIEPEEPYEQTWIPENTIRSSSGRLLGFDLVFSTFIRSLPLPMFRKMGKRVEFSKSQTVENKFGVLLKNTDAASLFFVIKGKQAGTFLITLSPALIDLAIDIHFGGDGAFLHPREHRRFTDMDRQIATSFVETLLNEFSSSIPESIRQDFDILRVDDDMRFLIDIAGFGDNVAVSDIAMELYGGSGYFHFCFPIRELEKILPHGFLEKGGVENKEDRQKILGHIPNLKVECDISIGDATLSIDEILNLKPGDVIRLNGEGALLSGGVKLFDVTFSPELKTAIIGRHNGKKQS